MGVSPGNSGIACSRSKPSSVDTPQAIVREDSSANKSGIGSNWCCVAASYTVSSNRFVPGGDEGIFSIFTKRCGSGGIRGESFSVYELRPLLNGSRVDMQACAT